LPVKGTALFAKEERGLPAAELITPEIVVKYGFGAVMIGGTFMMLMKTLS
jgi:hypothetical protein